MPKKFFVNAIDLENGYKRINLSLSISDVERLVLISESKAIPITTMVASWVIGRSREEEKRLMKSGYIPVAKRGFNLFDKPNGRRKK